MSSPFHFFGIRHHGPASARSLLQALETLAPDCLLIEGPVDAQVILPLLLSADLVPPVALLIYTKDATEDAVFYPFAEFSPEWQALRYGFNRNIPTLFIDLPDSQRFALQQQARQQEELETATSENQTTSKNTILTEDQVSSENQASEDAADVVVEAHTIHAEDNGDSVGNSSDALIFHDPLTWLAQASGFADGESWWNHWIEEQQHSSDIFAAITEAMLSLREEYELAYPNDTSKPHQDLREASMRKALRAAQKQGYQKIAVVCGAWHVPALLHRPSAKEDAAILKNLPKIKVEATWVPWTYQRLSRQSGYGAGIASPQWYAHLWHYAEDAQRSTRWLATVAALFRGHDLDCSSAHVIETTRLADTLAVMRGRRQAGLEELLEAIQTVMCMGDATPLRLVHDKLIIGYQIGRIPADAASVPLQRDLEQQQKTLRLKPEASPVVLDLDLRKPQDLAKSELLHRLTLLGIPWGELTHQSQRSKGTFHEFWQLQWQPELSIKLIEKSPYGRTVVEAASQYMLFTIKQEQRLDSLAQLIALILCANLPQVIAGVMARLDDIAATVSDVSQFLRAVPPLVNTLRYGNVRQTDSNQLTVVLQNMVARISIGLPLACAALDDAAAEKMLKDIKQFKQALDVLLQELPALQVAWLHCLQILSHLGHTHRTLSGLSTRYLFDAEALDITQLESTMTLALSAGQAPEQVAAWLEGFLSDSALVLLHHDALWALLDDWLMQLPDEVFQNSLPMLRRAFANFNPSERHDLGVRARAGGNPLTLSSNNAGQFDATRYALPLPLLARLLGRSWQASNTGTS